MGLFSSILSIFEGRRQERRDERNTAEANANARRAATVAFQRGRRVMHEADRMSDRNTRQAQGFQVRQTDRAWQHTDQVAARNRRLARQDAANQFVDARDAALRGGFNPLTGVGASASFVGAGLTASSYAAAPGVGAMSVNAPQTSVAMTYGAPLSSNAAMMGAVGELGRELTGEAAVERANAQVYSDIARIELERMQSGLAQPVIPHLGRSGTQSQGPNMLPPGWLVDGWQEGPAPIRHRLDPMTGFYVEQRPMDRISGLIDIQNPIAADDIRAWGSDGEPWEGSEVLNAGVAAGTQTPLSWGRSLADGTDTFFGARDNRPARQGWGFSFPPLSTGEPYQPPPIDLRFF